MLSSASLPSAARNIISAAVEVCVHWCQYNYECHMCDVFKSTVFARLYTLLNFPQQSEAQMVAIVTPFMQEIRRVLEQMIASMHTESFAG